MALVNPYHDPGRDTRDGYQRRPQDEGRGYYIPNIRTPAQARTVFSQYAAIPQGQPGSSNFQNFLSTLQHNTGSSDWQNASDDALYDAMDQTFAGYNEDNQKTNKFGDSILGKVLGVGLPFAANAFLPGSGFLAAGLKGAAAGALGSGIMGGNALKGAGIGIGAGLLGEGARNLWNSGGTSIFGSNEAFTNPDALGIGGSDLYNPGSLGGIGDSGVTNLAGGGFTNTGGLGLNALDWASGVTPETWAGTENFDGGGFFNPGGFGSPATNPGIATALYDPVSLGGTASTGINNELLKLGGDVLGSLLAPDEPIGGAPGMSLGGGGGGAARAPYIPMSAPAAPALPQYFGFNQNPFNALGGIV